MAIRPLTIWASLSPTKLQHRAAGAVRSHRGREPDLAGAALHLVLLIAVALVERRKLAAELDHVAVTVVPLVQHARNRRRWRRSTGSRGTGASVCRSCPLYRADARRRIPATADRNCGKIGVLGRPLVAARPLRLRPAPWPARDRPAATCAARASPVAAAPIRWRAFDCGPRRTARSGIHRASWRRPAPAGRWSTRPASRSRRHRAAARRNAPCQRPRSWPPRSHRRR